jgi:hypothetical protein
MGPPEWQFWTDWAVKALGTLATLLAVVVALFVLPGWAHQERAPTGANSGDSLRHMERRLPDLVRLHQRIRLDLAIP